MTILSRLRLELRPCLHRSQSVVFTLRQLPVMPSPESSTHELLKKVPAECQSLDVPPDSHRSGEMPAVAG